MFVGQVEGFNFFANRSTTEIGAPHPNSKPSKKNLRTMHRGTLAFVNGPTPRYSGFALRELFG
jgi:hypothetical protein